MDIGPTLVISDNDFSETSREKGSRNKMIL